VSVFPLGAHVDPGGARFAVASASAESVEVCLVDGVQGAYTERRVELTERTFGVWHGHVPGVGAGQRYGLPWFEHRDAIFLWREGPAGEPSPWGVLQPPPEAEALAPDIVLVPLVLADRLGTRIGHGKGHYDRALSHLREGGSAFTIGLGWESQVVDGPIPPDPWDMKLDAIATPGEWIQCA